MIKIIDITKDIPKSNYSTDRNGYVPSAFVLHITADSKLQNVLNWFKNPNALVSAHYVIAKNGYVYMCVNPLYRAFHAGRVKNPTAKIYYDFNSANPNNYTIGIECVSSGERLTEEQEQSLIYLIKNLCSEFGIAKDRYSIIGHNELDVVDRAFDPIKSYTVDYILYKIKGGFVMLSQGDRGTDVRALQEKLNRLGYNLDEDGIFGANTEKAILNLQKQNGLNSDGVVGPETLKFINGLVEKLSVNANETKKDDFDIKHILNTVKKIDSFLNKNFKNY